MVKTLSKRLHKKWCRDFIEMPLFSMWKRSHRKDIQKVPLKTPSRPHQKHCWNSIKNFTKTLLKLKIYLERDKHGALNFERFRDAQSIQLHAPTIEVSQAWIIGEGKVTFSAQRMTWKREVTNRSLSRFSNSTISSENCCSIWMNKYLLYPFFNFNF